MFDVFVSMMFCLTTSSLFLLWHIFESWIDWPLESHWSGYLRKFTVSYPTFDADFRKKLIDFLNKHRWIIILRIVVDQISDCSKGVENRIEPIPFEMRELIELELPHLSPLLYLRKVRYSIKLLTKHNRFGFPKEVAGNFLSLLRDQEEYESISLILLYKSVPWLPYV